jgi:small subunit ribosomal protein S8
MSLSDPIADLLTRIRNANTAGHQSVELPRSNMKSEIAKLLKREGYIKDYTTEGQAGKKTLRLYLKYGRENDPVIRGLRRVSRPGLRRYVNASELPRVLGGLGVAIVSTSKGLMTDREARKAKVGGEVLCYVW